MTYLKKKESVRQAAIEWQNESGREMSYKELADCGAHFNLLGRRYGLLKEFRENGIPC